MGAHVDVPTKRWKVLVILDARDVRYVFLLHEGLPKQIFQVHIDFLMRLYYCCIRI